MNHIQHSVAIVTIAMLTGGAATNAVAQAESQKADTEWRGYNGDYDATRFSSLTQINKENGSVLSRSRPSARLRRKVSERTRRDRRASHDSGHPAR
jgi:hypothetical protein